ncbi:LOW QUALITY PROTEIN: DNA oxidative demethylase ALKBH2 [Pterocles gutturalis]
MDRCVKRPPGEAGGGGGKRPRPEEPPSGSPRQEIRAEGLSCDYRLLFVRAELTSLQQLEEEVEYFEGEKTKLHVFGKWHDIPRKQVTYGDPELTYTYSGVTFPKPWIPVSTVSETASLWNRHTFNFVLINRYKDGGDHIGEHRDDERELVPQPIASVSFGACRDFVFRHCDSRGKNATRHIKPQTAVAHGSLLMMKYPTRYWYTACPSQEVLAPRINLTFRKVMTIAEMKYSAIEHQVFCL